MGSDLLLPILKRLESEPSLFCAEEVRSCFGPVITTLESRKLLRRAKSATSLVCVDCGGHACQVAFVKNEKTGQQHGYISCPECGVTQIDKEHLKRWQVSTVRLLECVIDGAGIQGAIDEVTPGLVWRLGKARWNGHSREVYFVRRCRGNDASKIGVELSHRPKTIVLTTTEATARKLCKTLNNLIISLDCVASFNGDHSILVDTNHIEGRIAEKGLDGQSRAKRPVKRRASRTADIDALQRELIAHIKAARDHAVAARDRGDEAKLLPRPSREELGRCAGVKPHSVTRCFTDRQAHQLRFLWDIAADPEQILCYRG